MSKLKPKTKWRIFREAEGEQFTLADDTGKVIKRDKSRAKLSEHAFDHGANEVLHDYDLIKYK